MKLLRIINVNFKVTDELLMRYSAFVRQLTKNWSTVGWYRNYL